MATANASIHNGDLHINGAFSCRSMSLPADTVGSTEFDGSDPLATAKQVHRYTKQFVIESGTSASDQRKVVHVVRGATATLKSFVAGNVTAASGADTVAVDLLVNGTSVLASTIELNSASTAYVPKHGVIDDTELEQDDVVEIKFDFTSGGGTPAQGCFAQVELDEDPA